ncbi:MAG TPA: hypothetical protein VIW69_02330 [Candidatus Elarobacter sp.]
MIDALGNVLRLIGSFFPPELSPHYLSALLRPIAETIGMAAAGMLVAFALGVPLAVAIATRAPGHRLIVAALSSLRAIPDLTLAILAVVVLGLGPAAGIAALAVFYTQPASCSLITNSASNVICILPLACMVCVHTPPLLGFTPRCPDSERGKFFAMA